MGGGSGDTSASAEPLRPSCGADPGLDMHTPPPGNLPAATGAASASAEPTPAALVQQHFAWVGRSIGFGIWEVNVGTQGSQWDEQMWRLRGREPQPGLVCDEQRRGCLHPDDRERVEELRTRAVQDGMPFEYEFRIVRPDGQVRWLASRSVESAASGAGARRRTGINWDITDSRNTEDARRQQAVAEAELRAKAQFLARMSHELRTPLNAVLGFTELLLERESSATGRSTESALRHGYLSHVHTAGRQLLTLVDDVLDLSRVEGGEARLQMAPVGMSELLAEVLALLEPQRVAAEVTLQLQLDAGPVMADAGRLRQVLCSLLSNAIRYNRPGGQVRIEWMPRGPASVERLLRISDTGRGMSEQQLLHLFEPFSLSGHDRNRDSTSNSEYNGKRGSGMGLAIIKALVERMGGSVHAASREGLGSVFELWLTGADAVPSGATLEAAAASPATPLPPPLAATEPKSGWSMPEQRSAHGPAPQPAPHPALHPAQPSPCHQLLYIEDNPVNALIISELLGRRDDLRLAIATDGHSGVAEARRLQPALILLDMQLPDVDGFEVLRQLRADPGTRSIPCVALSANAMPEDIQRAMHAGMTDYWTKPLDFKRFLTALDAMLGAQAAPTQAAG